MAAAERCEELPQERQAPCWMLQSCALLDGERRTECLRLAKELEDMLAKEQEATEAAAVAPDVPAVESPPGVAPSPKAAATSDEPAQPDGAVIAERNASDAAAGAEPTREPVAVASRSDPKRVSETTVERKVLSIPKEFVGDVTAHRRLVRNKQLIAVDHQLLFEGDVAAESNLSLGDSVEVRRMSSAFGERYRILGPSNRAVRARRILCERVDVSSKTRQRCAMLRRGDAED